MNIKSKTTMKAAKPFHSILTTLASTAILSGSVQAVAVIYEPFDYTAGANINGIGGASAAFGWGGGNWSGDTSFKVGSNLSFGNLDSTGGSSYRPDRSGNGAVSRTIINPTSLSTLQTASTIWFSVLMDPTGGNGFAANSYGTLIFGDTAFTGGDGGSAPALAGGDAFGVGFVGESNGVDSFDFAKVGIQGVAYDNGALTTAGDASVADLGDVVSFIVGRMDFAPNGSNDTLRLYRVTDTNLTLPASPFATLTADLDQSGFNIVSIGDSQTSIFDEIRIGTSLADVVPEPSSLTLLGLGALSVLRRRRV